MTRRAGQVGTGHVLAGLAVVLLLAAGLVVGLSALVDHGPRELVGPSEAGAPLPCPSPLRGGHAPVAVSSSLLLECPDSYDGAGVRYRGEVVGMVLRRGPRAWVQLNDDAYALQAGPLPAHNTPLGPSAGTAVSVPVGVADQIDHVGGARAVGTQLEVVGTFLRADPADGGAPAISADTVVVVDPGRRLPLPVDRPQALVAGLLTVLTATAAAVVALHRLRG